jgi:hypothetical protein
MESQKLNKLAEKFWQGECSQEEEQILRQALQKGPVPQELAELAEYLSFFEQERQEQVLPDDFAASMLAQLPAAPVRRWIPGQWWKMAAGIILVLGLGYGISQFANEPAPVEISTQEDTYEDAEMALEEVKKALMLVSTNMNEGVAPASLLKEFHEAKEELKTN